MVCPACPSSDPDVPHYHPPYTEMRVPTITQRDRYRLIAGLDLAARDAQGAADVIPLPCRIPAMSADLADIKRDLVAAASRLRRLLSRAKAIETRG